MLVFRIQYDWYLEAGASISQPVRRYYSIFHFPVPIEVMIEGRKFTTRPNAFLISRPMEPRWFYAAERTQMNWMHARKEIAPLLEEYQIPVGQVFYPGDGSFLPGLFRKMRMEFLSSDLHKEALMDSYLTEMLIKLSRAVHSDRVQLKLDEKVQIGIKQLRLKMLSHPEREWSVETLARQVSLSSSRFHVVYKAMFGISPIRDLIAARVDRAKSILIENKVDTLAKIAEQLGYKNQYDFSRQFKGLTGISPGMYRKKNQ